ncbi:BLUF domain-containing protein [Rhodalgimonas zhirmunskyi]|uniref:BLUF domain-containing protein n=1 Tax=Rhodalgimonas zhirmunskyi TaxID=2964767 RepID=A0AAJ1U8R5_9RHOB|nr:BLUF domain-containing protein [Rhodoalgimonas zhirmunskyi]MDQ2093208.1 BLUF domain-containing protein [Rhodoalgimonas zhirmunskyi]
MTLDQDLSYLLYRSRALFSEDDLSNLEILRSAILFNACNSITGFLCRDANFFVQILEGPTHTITALLEKIRTDPRHEDLELLETAPIKARDYPQWSMGYAQATVMPETTFDKMEPAALRDLIKTASISQGRKVIYNLR